MRLIIYIILVFSISCTATKKLKPIPERSKEDILQILASRNIDFDWFSAKISTRLESPDENISGTMIVQMKKDSAILIAVKKFGIEAARVFIEKDSYTVLYRLEAAYESGPIDQIKQIASISANFEDLQQLMFGNILLLDPSKTNMIKDSIYYIVQGKVDDILLEYYVNGYNLQLEKMKITDNMNRIAIAEYGDYRKMKGYGNIPYYRKFQFPYTNDEQATIEMQLSFIDINVPLDIKFSIPMRYEKIN
jgi:hypothetical protein